MNKYNFAEKYDMCLNSQERKNKVYEEAKFLQNEYHINNAIKKCIARHYFINYRTKVGDVSKNFKFVDSILIYYGFTDEERTKFINTNYRMFLTNYNDFRIRLALFNKCGLFEEALFKKNRFLTNYSSYESISVSALYAIASRKSFDISFDEIDSISKSCVNFKELVSKYKLTNEIIKEMDNELILKIKSFAKGRKLIQK